MRVGASRVHYVLRSIMDTVTLNRSARILTSAGVCAQCITDLCWRACWLALGCRASAGKLIDMYSSSLPKAIEVIGSLGGRGDNEDGLGGAASWRMFLTWILVPNGTSRGVLGQSGGEYLGLCGRFNPIAMLGSGCVSGIRSSLWKPSAPSASFH